MSKINNGGLDQYGAKPLEQQQFGTAGVEVVSVIQSQQLNNVTETGCLVYPLLLALLLAAASELVGQSSPADTLRRSAAGARRCCCRRRSTALDIQT